MSNTFPPLGKVLCPQLLWSKAVANRITAVVVLGSFLSVNVCHRLNENRTCSQEKKKTKAQGRSKKKKNERKKVIKGCN